MSSLRKGLGVSPAVLVVLSLTSISILHAEALDPNGGSLFPGDVIVSNIAQAQVVFDASEGTMGSLVPFDGADGAGYISTSNPYYVGNYTFGLSLTLPLAADLSPMTPGTAHGLFGGGTYSYELLDLENGNAVLLSGDIVGGFNVIEGFNNVLNNYGGGGAGGGIAMTVTGGSLSPHFPEQAEMFLQYWIAAPPSMQDFSSDLITGGGGSFSIRAVPEPTTGCLLIVAGFLSVCRRRRLIA